MKNLEKIIIDNIEKILDSFDISYHKTRNSIFLACPIHKGDNTNGVSIFMQEKYGYIGNWKCWTNHCELKYGSSIVGLIRGILGVEHYKVKHWAEKFLNTKITDNKEKIISGTEDEYYFNKLADIFRPILPIGKNSPGKK